MEGDKRKVRIQKVLFPVSLIAILTRSSFRRTKAGLYCVWPTRQKVTFCRLKVGAKHDAKLQNFLKTKYKNLKKTRKVKTAFPYSNKLISPLGLIRIFPKCL